MSIFGNIMSKIFHHSSAAPAPTPQAAPSQSPAAPAAPTSPAASGPASDAAAVAPPPASVDVGAVLAEMADMKGGGGNYRTSIVDLLKLLDLDSGLAARKELANELNVHVGEDGSAEENIALHKAVMAELAKNGGVVPDSLRG